MATTLLRTLTEKSTLGFGKYKHMPVANAMKLPDGARYLRWTYFNCSNISFTEPVLTDLKITGGHCIKKPGKNPQKYDQLAEQIKAEMRKSYDALTDEEKKQKLKQRAKNNKIYKTLVKDAAKSREKAVFFGGAEFRRRLNQGHDISR